MASIPDYKAPTRSDIPELPEWAIKMLEPINDQLKTLTQELQKTTFEDRDVLMENGETVSITPQTVKGKPKSAEILFTTPEFFHQETVQVISDTDVRITAFFSDNPQFSGDPPEDPVLCRIRIWGS